MSVKLFILGRPGSGKSAAYRHIAEYLRQYYKGWSIARYDDYDLLQSMFLFETLFSNNRKPKQFKASAFGGFDVVDFTVLDIVLKEMEKKVRERLTDKKEELVIIEFARQDYNKALRLFSPSFLKNSYFLFIEADVKTCLERVKKRISEPPTPDNHFVSEDILTSYYSKQLLPSLSFFPSLPKIHHSLSMILDRSQTRIINSHGALPIFNKRIEAFVNHIFVHSGYDFAKTMPLRRYPVLNPQGHAPFHKKERQTVATRS